MTRTKKSAKAVLIALSVSMLMSATAMMASATNIDRPFNFAFSDLKATTGAAQKDNDSSLYMYCEDGTTNYIASAAGSNNTFAFADCSYDPRLPQAQQRKYTYAFAKGTKRFMYNYVKENNFKNAAIMATTSSFGRANGQWSPDSVYEAGVLPPSDYIR